MWYKMRVMSLLIILVTVGFSAASSLVQVRLTRRQMEQSAYFAFMAAFGSVMGAFSSLAGIADDIRAMPMGMQTLISEGQGGISGGQKQRLMIARAVAPKPSILIFDEATSALDNKTQKQVSGALDKLNCTRIVIAHRLSTIRNCDRILVMDKGTIIEEGTYDDLIAQNGHFAELVARQRLDAAG